MDEHQAKRAIGVQVEVARRFAAEHWPHHNAKQGIAWEQTDQVSILGGLI